MNELQIFNNTEFGDVRTVEINGKPYFMASDVAKALGYTNPNKFTSAFRGEYGMTPTEYKKNV